MAKYIVVGSSERKGSFCPLCRKRVPKEGRLPNGVKCNRCGFTAWEDFKKYKTLDAVPVPDPKNTVDPMEVIKPEPKKEVRKPEPKKAPAKKLQDSKVQEKKDD